MYKRLARARDRLREAPADIQTPPLDTLTSRLPSVHAVLYLLFNEGYLSAHPEHAIRRDCATRPSGWPHFWRGTLWARSLRRSPCSRSCICMRPGWGRAATGWEACYCSRSRTGPCGDAGRTIRRWVGKGFGVGRVARIDIRATRWKHRTRQTYVGLTSLDVMSYVIMNPFVPLNSNAFGPTR